MASIKEYNRKLKSLVNTRKITKTMKMVAVSKLRKAYEAQAHAKFYAQNLTALISRISVSVEAAMHALLASHVENRRALVVLLTSDNGLCGSFNHNAINGTIGWISKNQNRFQAIDLSFCGRRGYLALHHWGRVKTNYQDATAHPKFNDAKRIGSDLCDVFLNNTYGEIYLAYNQFFNPLSQKMIIEKILPIDPNALIHQDHFHESVDYLFEPQAAPLLKFLIPHFIYFKIYFALLENSAGEHGARMVAMDNATKNATELVDRYLLLRNRARQAEITTELTEIVAGVEAFK